MPKDMFGDIVEPSIKVGSQQWYTVPLSIIVHTAIIGAVVIIPLMAADVLPTPPSMMAFVAAPPARALEAVRTVSAAASASPKRRASSSPPTTPAFMSSTSRSVSASASR